MSFENDGKPWEYGHLVELVNLYEQGMGWGKIASNLGRTVPACVVKLRALRWHYKLPTAIWKMRSGTFEVATLQVTGRD